MSRSIRHRVHDPIEAMIDGRGLRVGDLVLGPVTDHGRTEVDPFTGAQFIALLHLIATAHDGGEAKDNDARSGFHRGDTWGADGAGKVHWRGAIVVQPQIPNRAAPIRWAAIPAWTRASRLHRA